MKKTAPASSDSIVRDMQLLAKDVEWEARGKLRAGELRDAIAHRQANFVAGHMVDGSFQSWETTRRADEADYEWLRGMKRLADGKHPSETYADMFAIEVVRLVDGMRQVKAGLERAA